MARSSECTDECAPKVLDTADIVRDEMLRQSNRNNWCPKVPTHLTPREIVIPEFGAAG
jgi:hypothetical protein